MPNRISFSPLSTDHNYGQGVAVSGDGLVMAVGVPRLTTDITNQGGVYIYDYIGGAWVQRGAVLTAADAAVGDAFGRAVALSANGLVLAVGAFTWEGPLTNQGGVYLYDYTGGAWVQRGAVLTAADAAASDSFGTSVALSGNGLIMAVGAYLWEGTLTNQGGVYLYDYTGGAWVQRGAALAAADAAASDYFGVSVALSDDGLILAVGAYLWEGPLTNQGGVYLYDYTGGAWVQRGAALTAADAAGADYFGMAVALSANGLVLTVGASSWEGPVSNQGGVYLYDYTGGAWVQRGAALTAADAAANDNFGMAVALSDNGLVLAVGAPFADRVTADQGVVYLYDYTAGAWVPRDATLTCSMTFGKGRVFPIDDPAQVSVAVAYSEGKQLYAYDKGVSEKYFYLTFERLPKVDYTAFENWLVNVAVGPKIPFTYTDEAGARHTVRLMDTKMPLREVSTGLYSGTITLRKEIS